MTETDHAGPAATGPIAADVVDDPERDELPTVPQKPQSFVRSAVEWVVIIGAALVVALVVKTFLLQAFYIPSGSMERTLDIGDRVLVNKLSYILHDVNHGDVVVFDRPEGETSDPEIKDLIKRVIGLPGDTVEARDGVVYLNGSPLKEPYLQAGTPTLGLTTPVVVPEGHIFVMGDNRTNSKDSRVFGAIDDDLVVGRAFVRIWPLGRLDVL